MKRFVYVSSFWVLLLFTTLQWRLDHAGAHSVDHHEHDTAHMEAMHAIKEQIPEELRIMDRTPLSPTPKSLARGRQLYATFCATCHGVDGRGDGPAAAGLKSPPASFLDLHHSAMYGPGEKYWIIGHGIPELGMPGFAEQLEPRQRWDLVNFILDLQELADVFHHDH
jgi:mono/diheme cytochrome c family protein